MTDTSAGFRVRGTMSGAPIRWQTFKAKDTETLNNGDIVNLESGEVDLGATNDTAFVGVIMTESGASVSAVDSTTDIRVTTNHDIILGVYDLNARAMGDPLDLSGATGAQTVTTNSNTDFKVFRSKTASDPETWVIFANGEHILV